MWLKLITVFSLFFLCTSFSFAQNLALNGGERAALEAELRQLEEESKKIQADLENKRGTRKNLEGELSLINAKK